MAQWVPAYEAALTPASEQGRRRVIGKIALAYPGAKISDDEAEARLELYADALDDIPSDILGIACKRVVRECRFFPSPSEIRDRCTGLAKRQWELSKIRALIVTHDRRWQPASEAMTETDRADFAKLAKHIA